MGTNYNEGVGSVLWIGNSKLTPLRPSPNTVPKYCMALEEDSVLWVAFNGPSNLFRVSKYSAVACTSRLALRVGLSTTDLNPPWMPYTYGDLGPKVIKAPASAYSVGVCLQDRLGEVELLKDYCPELAKIGVVEDRVGDEQWEIDGAIVNGAILWFNPLKQTWDERNERILGYTSKPAPPGLLEAADTVLEALQMDNTPFCFEFRRDGGRWFLIDAHCRLGEDPGLGEKMCSSGDPHKEIEEYILEAGGWS